MLEVKYVVLSVNTLKISLACAPLIPVKFGRYSYSNILGKERKYRDIVIKVDGTDCSDQTVVCNKLNDYFISIANNINDIIPASNKSPLEYMGDRLPHSFFCLPATSEEVQKILSNFVCKGCNHKSISMFIYNYLSPVISPIISKFFNISIEEGVFPDCLKTGRVVSFHKSSLGMPL